MEPLDELWVAVEGFPNYVVSNHGRVVNVLTEYELTPNADKNGYLRVKLSSRGVAKSHYIHRLVAQAFFLNYAEGREVKHKNGVLSDNTVFNLTLNGRPCRASDETHEKERRTIASYIMGLVKKE